jgi:DNA-binding response OmpR family regulator
MKKSILLVDDDKTAQSVIKTLLELEGFTVISPPSLIDMDSILKIIHEAKPNFVIMDIHLKSINGLDILKNIRIAAEIQPKILMVSGKDMRDACYAAGADHFLLKPFMPEEMVSFLQ